MLTDDSASEQRAVRAAFPEEDERVEHLLCRVHLQRTIDRRFLSRNAGFGGIRRHLAAMLYSDRTRQEALASVDAAIRAAPTDRDREYLRVEWRSGLEQRAHYARCSIAILLQTPSTNPVEGWHKALKHEDGPRMVHWSLCGLVEHIEARIRSYETRLGRAEREWSSLHFARADRWPGMRLLPSPAQKLCVSELKHGLRLREEGKLPSWDGGALRHDCQFWRKWQLPCRHLWLAEHVYGDVLGQDYWEGGPRQ